MGGLMSLELQDPNVDLCWLPLGAGGRSVRWNGRLFEAGMARREHRPVEALYHSALEVIGQDRRFVIEMAPVWNVDAVDRGVVREGPVGTRWLGRSQLFSL
jgi:hypothetical protein